MRKISLVLPFFFLFFLLSVSQVKAYQIFSYNPTIDSDIKGYSFAYDNNVNPYYNATCYNMTGCLIVENNGTTSVNRIILQQSYSNDWNISFYTPDYTNLTTIHNYNAQTGFYDILLPANEEGILNLTYLINQTLTSTVYPQLIVSDVNHYAINSTTLNTTPNAWHKLIYIINATPANRILHFSIIFSFDNLPSQFVIDKFKFYTMDSIENHYWVDNNNTEITYFCGINAISLCSSSAIDDSFILLPNNKGFLYGTDSEGYNCDAIKLGELTIARRVISLEDKVATVCGNCGYQIHVYRDSYFITSCGGGTTWNCGFEYQYFVESHSLLAEKITLIYNYTNTNKYGIENYDGSPKAYVFTGNTSFLVGRNLTSRENIDLTSYLTTATPAGLNWRWCMYADSNCGSYHSFFTSGITSCSNQGWSCSIATNNETFSDSSCAVTQNNWCGECGCGASRCAYPSTTGTICDMIDPIKQTYITMSNDCTGNITNYCPTGSTCEQLTPQFNATYGLTENIADCSHCYFLAHLNSTTTYQVDKSNCLNTPECFQTCEDKGMGLFGYWLLCYGNGVYHYNITIPVGVSLNSSAYTIACINPDGSTAQVIDQFGNNTTEQNIVNNIVGFNVTEQNIQPPTYTTNAFGYASLLFGSLFGMGEVENLTTDEAGLSILISLLIGFVAVFYEKKSQHVGTFGSLAFLGTFLLCSVMANNILVYALFGLLAIFDAGIMTGYFKKLIGGG